MMPHDLIGTIFYQELFCGAKWFNCDLTDVSGNGTIFKQNDFNESKINNVSFQYCSFLMIYLINVILREATLLIVILCIVLFKTV